MKPNKDVEDKIRDVRFKDKDINVEVNDKNDEAVIYGDVECTENMKETLTLNAKMMTYNKISKTDIEIEMNSSLCNWQGCE